MITKIGTISLGLTGKLDLGDADYGAFYTLEMALTLLLSSVAIFSSDF